MSKANNVMLGLVYGLNPGQSWAGRGDDTWTPMSAKNRPNARKASSLQRRLLRARGKWGKFGDGGGKTLWQAHVERLRDQHAARMRQQGSGRAHANKAAA